MWYCRHGLGWKRVRSTLHDGTWKCRWMKCTRRCARLAGKYGPKYVAPSFRSRRVTYTRGYFSLVSLMYGIRLVVAQQDVEARLVLLDEVVFERQRLFFVVDQDVVDVARFGDQGAGLDVGQLVLGKVAADAVAQALRLAHVDHAAAGVFVQVHAGRKGKLRYFFSEFHGGGLLSLYGAAKIEACPAGSWRCLPSGSATAQEAPPKKLETERPKPATSAKEEIPPEEDAALTTTEYSFNPLQSVEGRQRGQPVPKRGKFRAAEMRYTSATKWNDGNAEAWLRLGEVAERLKDTAKAKEAYKKYLELASDAKNAEGHPKRVGEAEVDYRISRTIP